MEKLTSVEPTLNKSITKEEILKEMEQEIDNKDEN